jgi:DNA-binding Lrp family transcriptional regulator
MTGESRNVSLVYVPEHGTPTWSFLTNHAQVLLCIAQDPGIRLREIGERVGITERAAHRIVAELAAAGYISRTRAGRRNRYTIQSHLPLPDALARGQRVGDLLAILIRQDAPRAHEDAPRIHEDAPRVHEDAPRVHEDAPPVHEDSRPVHEDAPRIHEDSPPVHEDSRPVHAPG